MNDMTGMQGFGRALESAALDANVEIGRVLEVSGSGSRITLDGPILSMLSGSDDPTIATAGNIGSHVKVMLDNRWLVGIVRTMRLAEADGDLIVADIDFLGEGLSSKEDNRLQFFRRTLLQVREIDDERLFLRDDDRRRKRPGVGDPGEAAFGQPIPRVDGPGEPKRREQEGTGAHISCPLGP